MRLWAGEGRTWKATSSVMPSPTIPVVPTTVNFAAANIKSFTVLNMMLDPASRDYKRLELAH